MFRRLTKPGWASAIGRDRFGLWCEIEVDPGRGEPVIQRLRWIPPGRFWMGSPEEETRGLAKNDDERKWFEWEHPRHSVTLTEGYWLFDTPCTQALWEAVMEKNPSRFQSPTRPVEQVTWNDARDFLTQLNGRIPDLNLALPSEAQWEYACRAGTETAIYTGDLAILGANNAPALDPIAWYSGNSGVDFDLTDGEDSSSWPEKQYPHERTGTRPVKLKQANPWGLYDMLGNVWEWCQDHWHDHYEGAPDDGSAWLSSDAGADRVLRGGSWYYSARYVRAAVRAHAHPGHRIVSLGFRCLRVRGEPSQPAGKSDAPGAGVAPSGAPGRQGDGSRSERPAQGGRSKKTKRK
ncbi:MAG: formylglycine-generating enzyme family protein [Candidatus Competibacteraceae bacterium]|nr:formylglycine-generating enzyme family protein [Candidatus Competibacteraceae bacterium]